MATRVTLDKSSSNQILVTKLALSGDRGDRKAEAEWLRSAGHSGVVELVSFASDPATIVTAHGGSETLRTRQPAPEAAARILAQVATTLADLHSRALAHGKLTPDHICLDGPLAQLCSPTGTSSDPTSDLIALSQIISAMLERWRAEGVPLDDEAVWVDLADRLAQLKGPYGGRRAVGPLTNLASPRKPIPQQPGRAPHARGLLVGGSFGLACLAGLLLLRAAPAPEGRGAELVVGSEIYRTGPLDGPAATSSRPCPGTPEAAILDPGVGEVWGFYDISDGSKAELMAVVPGSTDIEYRAIEECTRLWVIGPAGQAALSSEP